jgi:hypothetical protein
VTVSLGRYRHYKGHTYEVLGEAKSSETAEILGTAYIRLDASEAVVWVRPEAEFAQLVEGKYRFMKLSDETWRVEQMDCAENHYTAEEGRAMEKELAEWKERALNNAEACSLRVSHRALAVERDKARKRVEQLEEQLHEPGYVDALRTACEKTAALIPNEFRQNEDLDAVEALPDLVGKYIASLTEWSEDDDPIPEDKLILAAHPTRSGHHKLYAEAFRMVGAKRSKFALVDLVNWLLVRLATEKVSEGKRKVR